ncbi:hypothetical protein NOR_00716 [Metarhizium rileyi]|uniref:Uncharacterized protein n=1 Tax=Metarhizium rileyi (strain RCEF 4871) TaxID=1649241 RepID=A0A167JHG2_METRR|nr:hypothetical protein NOR_00716 [Metarhizium rileyi RCEF 4871]
MVWQISDSVFAFASELIAVFAAVILIYIDEDKVLLNLTLWQEEPKGDLSRAKYPFILAGSAVMMLASWPLIPWTELVVQRNRLESDTDIVVLELFITQVVTMTVPSCGRV